MTPPVGSIQRARRRGGRLSRLAVAWAACAGLAGPPAVTATTVEREPTLPAVTVDVRTATYKPRGRVLLDVLGLVRNRLRDAQIPLARDGSAPGTVTLSVDYQEERGAQYEFDTYATIVTGRFRLTGPDSAPLFDMTVRERSGEELFGTPPYIDAIQKFETNPYVYFLGNVVREHLVGRGDETAALIHGLREMMGAEAAGFDPLSAPHTMLEAETTYPTRARERTVRELGRLGDPRAVPVLTELLSHSDETTRTLAAQALAGITEHGPAGPLP